MSRIRSAHALFSTLFVLERLCAPSPGPALCASIISLLFVSPLFWSAYFWWGGHRMIKDDSDRLVLCELPENSLFKPLAGKRMYFSMDKPLYRWVWNGWEFIEKSYLEWSLKTLRWYLQLVTMKISWKAIYIFFFLLFFFCNYIYHYRTVAHTYGIFLLLKS